MSVFIRRFLFDPGTSVFLEIEAVNILDLTPAASIAGVGTGVACLVGEFEDGPFNTPTEVTSVTDVINTFGDFGFNYAGIIANNPSARSRKADGATQPEFWNGNGMVQLNGKKFARLVLCRADTSVGQVQFSRLAYLLGGSLFSYALTTGQTLVFDLLETTAITATFTGTPAHITSGAGTYPSTFVGGEFITLSRDGQPNIVVVFQAVDQTQAQVIARVNAALGYTAWVDNGGAVTEFFGVQGGTGGAVSIVAASALVLTATGFAAPTSAAGAGNVADISQVTPHEIDVIVSAASTGHVRVRQLPSGQLRMENVQTPLTGALQLRSGTAVTALGFTAGTQSASWQDGAGQIAITQIDAAVATATGFALGTQPSVIESVAGVYPSLFAGGEQMKIQVGQGGPIITVVFTAADQTQAQVLARINLALGYTAAMAQSGTLSDLAGVGSLNVAIASGTVVATPSGLQWVTMQTLEVTHDNPGPYLAKVRPAQDDGSALSALASAVTTVPNPVITSAFSTLNPLPLTAALTEPAIDAAYQAALDSTLASDSVAAQINLISSARQSNQVRLALRANALNASANGLRGRMCAVRPPLGTRRSVALSNASQPGVGAYRDQRVVYNYPGISTFVPAIATRGLSGGVGFSADGIVDAGSDGFLTSVCSQLPPEENPGQLTTFTGGAVGLERNNPDIQNLTIVDYTNFKQAGICAPRMDEGVMIFQSGVNSVDPAINFNIKNIARRRMADFIQDSLALAMKAFGKKLSTRSRRTQIIATIRAFLNGLLSPTNPASQRIDGFTLDSQSGNTATTLGQGIFRVTINVRTLASLDAIVLATTIGETVDITELAA